MDEQVDGALGEHRAQGEGHVGRGQQLLEGDGHQPRELAAAVVGGKGTLPHPASTKRV